MLTAWDDEDKKDTRSASSAERKRKEKCMLGASLAEQECAADNSSIVLLSFPFGCLGSPLLCFFSFFSLLVLRS